MKTFALTRARDSAEAINAAAKARTAQQGAEIRFIAGGTTLIDLMKLNVEQPTTLIDINRLPLDKIEALPDGGLKIGAGVRNSDLAHHPVIAAERIKGPELASPVKIKDNVWIGGGSIICAGVTIGENTTIGAGSVVVKNISANVVAVGNPCRTVKQL